VIDLAIYLKLKPCMVHGTSENSTRAELSIALVTNFEFLAIQNEIMSMIIDRII